MVIKVQTIENKAETFIEVHRVVGDAAGPFKPRRAEGPIAMGDLQGFSDDNISLAKLSKSK
jgi:hypothetical protein